MFKNILKIVPIFLTMKTQNNSGKNYHEKLFTKLIKGNTQFSSVNFFLIITTIIGCILLIIPIFGMLVDIMYNHTITIDLNGLAAYIVAVAGIFATGGIANAWTEYSYNKYNRNIFSENNMTNNTTNNITNNVSNAVDNAVDSVIDP